MLPRMFSESNGWSERVIGMSILLVGSVESHYSSHGTSLQVTECCSCRLWVLPCCTVERNKLTLLKQLCLTLQIMFYLPLCPSWMCLGQFLCSVSRQWSKEKDCGVILIVVCIVQCCFLPHSPHPYQYLHLLTLLLLLLPKKLLKEIKHSSIM